MSETMPPYTSVLPKRPVDIAGAARVAADRAMQAMPSSTRPISPAIAALLMQLRPGQHLKITQTVRVGRRQWPATVTGTFRGFTYLATGLATQRVPEDNIIVGTVHFTKDNGELSSISLDENSKIELIGNGL